MARSQDASQSPITPLGAILDLKTGKNLIHRPTAPSHNIKHCRLVFLHGQDPFRKSAKLGAYPQQAAVFCLLCL